jgi:hypothetical protein
LYDILKYNLNLIHCIYIQSISIMTYRDPEIEAELLRLKRELNIWGNKSIFFY